MIEKSRFCREFDENNPSNIILKVSDKKNKALKDLGIESLPKYCDLIPLPKQIYKRMLPDLVRQAKGWVDERKKLPNAMIHLLEKRSIPELIDLNKKIRTNPEETASSLTEFLSSAEGITLSLQGPPGTGRQLLQENLLPD